MTRLVNHTKTAALLGLLMGLFMLGGALLGGSTGLTLGLILGGAMNFGAFFFSDKIALKAMRGQEVDANTAPDLVEMVDRLARNAGLPMPRVYVCPQQAPNAFATGRSPKHAAVAVTHGALGLLDYGELEGVIGHELAHIKHRDTLISTVAATIAGVFSYLPYMLMFGGLGGGRDNPLGIVGVLLFVVLAPLAAAMIQMGISRSREYLADAEGARIAGTPQGLIGALQKLDAVSRQVPMASEGPSQNHMFIVQPLSGKGGGFGKLFSTHPATHDRIAKLRELA
ncbi:MAG: M48 family metalloprotease [Planctomycetota bacterium]